MSLLLTLPYKKYVRRVPVLCENCRLEPIRTGHNRKLCNECQEQARQSRSRLNSYVQRAIEEGKLRAITPEILCVDCGKVATRYDHRDYTKALEVEPVCCSCNGLRGCAKNLHLAPLRYPG